MGKEHGLRKHEVVKAVTQLAFYCGWPKAWSTFPLIEEVYGDEEGDEEPDERIPNKAEFEKRNKFGMGNPNTAYAKYFVGNSYLNQLTDPKTCALSVANVTFEPGCRNNYHIHHAVKGGGQLLICTAGSGWYVEEGKAPRSLNPGDVVAIPANVKHWHGAKKDSWFSHIAMEIPGEKTSTEWLEEVSDEEYDSLE
jgi:quercetin dioxygenase-like cupin family protein